MVFPSSRNLSLLSHFQRCRIPSVRVILSCLLLYGAAYLFYELTVVVLLRHIRANPRYVTVALYESGKVSGLHMLNKKPETPDDHTLLCVDTSFKVSQTYYFPICIHDPETDIYISGSLVKGELYEHAQVQVIVSHMLRYSSSVFVDIGANIGTYSLAVAKTGHPVVAVEAMPENVLRLKASSTLGEQEEMLTIVQAVASNTQGMYFPIRQPNRRNIGGTSMVPEEECYYMCDKSTPVKGMYIDDLIKSISFIRGVMKIDIEGLEEKALEHATNLLDQIDFYVILMEWTHYREMRHSPSSYPRVLKLVSFFTSRAYVPCEVLSERTLIVDQWQEWPDQVLWKKLPSNQ